MAEKIDYLEVDKPIPGQNYVCISFVSPENIYKQKELFVFNKYMNQRCGEFETKIDEIIKNCSDDLRHQVCKELKDRVVEEMKYDYDNIPVIKGIRRISKPGCRRYLPSKNKLIP